MYLLLTWAQLFKTKKNVVNKSFKTLIIKYGIYANIFAEKLLVAFAFAKIFSAKHAYELDIVLTRTVNILTTNELVKLMMLWTTGPWRSCGSWAFHRQANKDWSESPISIYWANKDWSDSQISIYWNHNVFRCIFSQCIGLDKSGYQGPVAQN